MHAHDSPAGPPCTPNCCGIACLGYASHLKVCEWTKVKAFCPQQELQQCCQVCAVGAWLPGRWRAVKIQQLDMRETWRHLQPVMHSETHTGCVCSCSCVLVMMAAEMDAVLGGLKLWQQKHNRDMVR